jgi:microcystin-dependent protein
MAFNFPNAPTLNQVFTPTSGVSYLWNGTQWDRLGPSAMVMPPGVYMPYGGATEPLGWLFCDGRALVRAAYPLLFAAIGIAHGAGDGSTTFNLPDMRGRAAFGRDDMGGTAAGRLTNSGVGNPGVNGALLGAAGGLDRYALAMTQLAAHQHPINGNTGVESAGHTHSGSTGWQSADHAHYSSGTTSDPGAYHRHTGSQMSAAGYSVPQSGSGKNAFTEATALTSYDGAHTHTWGAWSGGVNTNHYHDITTGTQSANHTHAISFMSGDNSGVVGEAHPNVPPALVANYIIFAGL